MRPKILDQIESIFRRIYELLNHKELLSESQINTLLKKIQSQLTELQPLFIQYYDDQKFDEKYRKFYQDIQKNLGLKASKLPDDIPTQLKQVRKDFAKAIDEMIKMADFNINERIRQEKAFVKSLNEGMDRRKKLIGLAKESKLAVSEAELRDIAKSIASKFEPITGVRKFRNEYYGLDGVKATREWENRWSKISNGMSNILKRSIIQGSTGGNTVFLMNKHLEKFFPNARYDEDGKKVFDTTFPIAVKNSQTGEIGIRRLGMKYYAEMKMRYYDSATESLATIDAMLDAGFDTVEYVLTGTNHSEICLEMEALGPIYSLSGKSEKYPKLDVYPPAHYNCKSKLGPLPSDEQERFKTDKEEVVSDFTNFVF